MIKRLVSVFQLVNERITFMKVSTEKDSWFPILVISEDHQQIFVANNDSDIPNDGTAYKLYEVNFDTIDVEFGEYLSKVNEKGYVYTFDVSSIPPKRVDVLENFALKTLVNTLPLDTVVKILEKGWGKIGCFKENENSNIGFFGPY